MLPEGSHSATSQAPRAPHHPSRSPISLSPSQRFQHTNNKQVIEQKRKKEKKKQNNKWNSRRTIRERSLCYESERKKKERKNPFQILIQREWKTQPREKLRVFGHLGWAQWVEKLGKLGPFRELELHLHLEKKIILFGVMGIVWGELVKHANIEDLHAVTGNRRRTHSA